MHYRMLTHQGLTEPLCYYTKPSYMCCDKEYFIYQQNLDIGQIWMTRLSANQRKYESVSDVSIKGATRRTCSIVSTSLRSQGQSLSANGTSLHERTAHWDPNH